MTSVNGAKGGIEAVFVASRNLAETARRIGADELNWYQFVRHDPTPPLNAIGAELAAPYIDPPCGGFGGD